jgi:pilus assembly protein CpaF
VAAVIPPCSVNGITLTIRKFTARNFTMNDLVETGTMPCELALALERQVLGSRNVLISGGTGTGKTTLLNILAGFIPNEQRLVIIEDTAEIQVRKDNLVRLEAARTERSARGEHPGAAEGHTPPSSRPDHFGRDSRRRGL